MSQQPQIVCQVCSTQQDNAWDCAVCGSALHDKPRHWAVPVQQVEGLEQTRLGDGGNVALEPMPGLELNAVDDGYEPLPEVLEGLELTSFPPVQAAPVPVLELEPTALPAVAEVTRRGAAACRYCGTAWQAGRSIFCARCGMRVGEAPPPRAEEPGERGVCTGCGLEDQPVGRACRACQSKVIAA